MIDRRRAAACLSAAVFTLAACGGDDDASSGGTASTAGDSTAVTEAGDAADESLSPVRVGFHNLEGGAISLPGIRAGFEQGVRYVNERLGGINGHPLEISSCNVDVTPESSVNCANQFVEEGVVAAVQGVDVAADAALPVLAEADIAEIAFFAFSPTVNKSPGDAFVTLFSVEEVYGASLIAQKNLGAKKVAALIVDLPTGHAAYEEAVAPVAEELGLDVTPYFYNQATTDWATFSATVLATNPDGIDMVAPSEADCTAAVPAFKNAGFEGVLHAGSCVEFRSSLDPEVVDGVINHNNYYESAMTEIPAKVQGELDIYRSYMQEEASEYVDSVYGTLGFSVAVDAADMLRQVEGDELTAATVKEALPKAKGTKFFTESPYDCSAPTWPGTSACGSEVLFSRNRADGSLELLDFAPVDVTDVVPG